MSLDAVPLNQPAFTSASSTQQNTVRPNSLVAADYTRVFALYTLECLENRLRSLRGLRSPRRDIVRNWKDKSKSMRQGFTRAHICKLEGEDFVCARCGQSWMIAETIIRRYMTIHVSSLILCRSLTNSDMWSPDRKVYNVRYFRLSGIFESRFRPRMTVATAKQLLMPEVLRVECPHGQVSKNSGTRTPVPEQTRSSLNALATLATASTTCTRRTSDQGSGSFARKAAIIS